MTNQEKQKELGLNDKQMAFCLEYVLNGFNATQAYVLVYKPKSQTSISANASRLTANDSVLQCIEFLKKPKLLEFEITRESQLKELTMIKKLALTPNDRGYIQPQHALKAIEIQNKMLGLDASTKVELSGAIEVNNIIKKIGTNDKKNN